MKDLKRKSLLLFGLVWALLGMVWLSGCGANYVSEKTMLEDLQKDLIFGAYQVEVEELTVIKRLSEEDQDTAYVNVTGKNEDYSLSQNYKMVYLPYNEGWLVETIEYYGDEDGYINEIVPLHGPTQEDVAALKDTITEEALESYCSDWISASLKEWDLADTGVLELDSYNSYAEYSIKIVFDYYWYREIVTVPVYFQFTDLSSGAWSIWYPRIESESSQVSRQYELMEEIYGNWFSDHVEESFYIAVPDTSYNISLTISPVEGDPSQCRIDNYTYSDDDTTYQTSGIMQLAPSYDESGDLQYLYLKWADGLYHPNYSELLLRIYGKGVFRYPTINTLTREDDWARWSVYIPLQKA